MKIGFIGAGKVGFSLGKYFKTQGIEVSGYFSRTPRHAQEAADFTETSFFGSLEAITAESDALFLTVPDAAISAAYQALPREAIKGKLICHCSGALPSTAAFADAEEKGVFGYSVHPLFAVSDCYRSYRELADVFFCIEGHPAHLEDIKSLLERCGNPVQIIRPEDKVRYHAAAAVASNHVVALVAESLDLLETCGFTKEGALNALRPILLGNMNHLAEVGPVESLTGPVERCDVGTVRKHLAAMPTEADKALYTLLSRKLVQVAEEKHPERDYQPMAKLLKGEFQL
jgi:predicted short-subunit dehydrogenase-like oxidoreductase (DUF2520 family)